MILMLLGTIHKLRMHQIENFWPPKMYDLIWFYVILLVNQLVIMRWNDVYGVRNL